MVFFTTMTHVFVLHRCVRYMTIILALSLSLLFYEVHMQTTSHYKVRMNCQNCPRAPMTTQKDIDFDSRLLNNSLSCYIVSRRNFSFQETKQLFLCAKHLVNELTINKLVPYKVSNVQGYGFKYCASCSYPMLVVDKQITDKRCFRC